MTINNVKVYGINESVKAAKYPMSVNVDGLTDEITAGIKNLAKAPVGSGHDNWLNGVIVQFDLRCSIKMWTEMERYHFVDFVSSQSTMHRLVSFDLDNAYDEHVAPEIVLIMKRLIATYNATNDKEDYLCCLYSNPCGMLLTARLTTNYRQLKTIYRQRRNHRLAEWRVFCEWIKTLPYSEFITEDNE